MAAPGPIRRIFTWLILIVGLPLSLHWSADRMMNRALGFTFPGWLGTYESAWPRIGGGVTIKNLTLVAPDRSDAFHFERVRLEIPFFQYYWHALKPWRDRNYKSISDIRLVFEGGKGDLTWPFAHGMAMFGNVSASPFEADGCVQDSAWISEELGEMGLSVQGTELVMAYHYTPERMIKEQSIHTPGAGRVDFRRELILHDSSPPLSLFPNPRAHNEVVSDEWHLKDEGFVAARNAFCAKKDGIDSAQFVERHLATVRRMMQVVGLAAGADMQAAYRRFATSGGSIDASVRYEPPIEPALYDNENLGAWVPRLHGEFVVGGQHMNLAVQSTAPRPLPEEADDEEQSTSVFALMQREGSVSAGLAAVSAGSSATPAVEAASAPSVPTVASATPLATTPAPPAPASATVAPATSVPAPVAPPVASSSNPIVAAPAGATVAAATPAPATPARAAIEPPVTTNTSADKLNLASTARVVDSVASVNAPPPLSASTAAVDAADPTLDYAQLGAAVGRSVLVHMKGKEPLRAVVVGVDKGVVQIRRHLPSGWVQYAVDRAAFDYAERRD